MSNHLVRFLRKSKKVSCLAANTNVSTRRLLKSFFREVLKKSPQSVHSKVKTVSTHAHTSPLGLSPHEPSVSVPRALHDIGHHHRDFATCPTIMTPPHGQQHKRTSLPTHAPGLLCSPPHQETLTSGTSSGQLAEERPCFVRPSSPDFHANDHKLGPPPRLLLPPCGCQCNPVVISRSATWPAIAVQTRKPSSCPQPVEHLPAVAVRPPPPPTYCRREHQVVEGPCLGP